MGQYRYQVRGVLELLSSMTQPYDPDGLDMFFSAESKKHKAQTNEQVLRLFDERPAYGLPDMRERFASIMEQYQTRFGKRNMFSRIRHPNSTPSKGPRRLSLYVLTDGVWQPGCTLVTEIKTLVSVLREHKLSNKHVGIQFICFGNNAEGKRRLQFLDSKLGLELYVVRDLILRLSYYCFQGPAYADIVRNLLGMWLILLQPMATSIRCFLEVSTTGLTTIKNSLITTTVLIIHTQSQLLLFSYERITNKRTAEVSGRLRV